jgi:uracil-DNA glycosylase
MQTQDIWDFIEAKLFYSFCLGSRSEPVFNIYSESNRKIERADANQIRRANLYQYLASFSERPSTLIVGEAPGWRGCRFSGVPFTSEAQLDTARLPFQGKIASLRTPPYSEATATIFWKVMAPYHPHFLAWNCIPFHLHRPGEPLSNRRPSKSEIVRFLPLLSKLVALLQPHRVIAAGRCAEMALIKIGVPALPLRHPSHGGAAAFERGIHNIFDHKLEKCS